MFKKIAFFKLQFTVFLLLLGPAFTLLTLNDISFAFIDVPSFLIIFPSSILILGMGGGVKHFFASYNYIFSDKAEQSQLKHSLLSIKAVIKMAFNWSVVSFLIGCVLILMNIEDMSALGPGFAAASLSFLYAFLFVAVFCLPLQMRLKIKLAAIE